MSEKTTIIFDNKELEYTKTGKKVINNQSLFIFFIIIFIIFFLSTAYSFLVNFEWTPIKTLDMFKRIKKNMNSWSSIMDEKTGIEINKGRFLFLTKPNVSNFQCLDFGSYYTAGRLSSSNYLPEFVRRGNSGPWIINKADINEDLSALQFCKYLLNTYVTKSSNLNNLISCGTDMFNKLGFGGYFIPNSPCERALETLSIS